MKKTLLFGAILLSLVSCNKALQEEIVEVNQEDVVLTFSSARPQLDNEAKTAWDGEKIVWSATDKIRVGFKLDGSWWCQSAVANPTGEPATYPKFYASDVVTIDNIDSSVGTFDIPVGNSAFTDPDATGTYQFFAVYPNTLCDATVNNPSAKSITIKETQSPGSNTFDAAADVLLGKSEEMNITGIPDDPIELTWTRVVAHAALTFSNMAFNGEESVSKITLTFNTDAKVTGSVTANIEEGTVGTGSSNVLVLDNGFTVSGSSISVLACVLPVTFTSLDVEIKTDKATYTRSIINISKTFQKNARNTLTIKMNSANREEVVPDSFALYSGTITDGDYIIYYDGKIMKAGVSSNRLQYTAATPSNDAITTNDGSVVWHIAESETSGYWTIYNASENKYAAATASKNQAQLLASGTDDRSLWSVSGSDTYEFVNKARVAAASDSDAKYLRNNGTYGFACYASAGGALSLYKKDTRTPLSAPGSVTANLNATDDSVIDIAFETVSGAASYGIVATPTSGDPVIITGVTASPTTISVSDGLSYDTEYTISVYAVPTNTVTYRNSVATAATGSVTTGSAPVITVSTILADDTVTSSNTVNYDIDEVTVMAKQGNNYVIGDATGVILMYYSGSALTVGNQYHVSGAVKLYNGVHEFTSPTVTASTGVAPSYGTPEAMSVSSLTSYASSPVTKYAVVSLTAPASGYVGSDGTNSINVFDGTGTWASFYGKNIIVTGYLIGFKDSKINILATDIIEDTTIPTISVSPASLDWGASETDNKTLTVTLNGAADADDYSYSVTSGTVGDWNISDNSAGTITVSPKAANTSTETAKTLTLRIAHKDDPSTVYQDVICTQAKKSSGGVVYTKVTSTTGLTDGTYLIVYEDGGLAFNGALTTLDVASNTIAVTISSSTIAQSATIDNASFTFDATSNTLQSASGYYIGRTVDSNGLNSSKTETYTNTVTIDNDGNAVILSSGGAYLRYNATSGQTRFRYFKSSSYSGQKAIQLYKRSTSL